MKLTASNLYDFINIRRQSSKESNDLIRNFLDQGYLGKDDPYQIPWNIYYELPLSTHITLLARLVGSEGGLVEAISDEAPYDKLLDWAQYSDISSIEDLENHFEYMCAFAPVHISLMKSLEAISYHSCTIHDLVQDEAGGFDQRLLDAVSIDPTVSCTHAFSIRLSRAIAQGNTGFLKSWARKCRNGPHGNYRYPDLRLAHKILDETGDLDSIKDEDLYKLVVEELNLYSHNSSDPLKGIKALFHRWG